MRHARAAGGLAIAGLTVAYVGSQVGLEAISDPFTIATEGLAAYHILGALSTAAKGSANFVLRILNVNSPDA